MCAGIAVCSSARSTLMGVRDVRVGDLFKSDAQTLVNTVNCVGVMGKGIAETFKKRFPEMFEDYARRCERGEVKLGEPYIWTSSSPWVLNFPTKDHWRSVARLADIERGLDYLVQHYRHWGIRSLAVPPLGCGHGGLDWSVVGPTLRRHLDQLDIPVVLYAPHGTPPPQLQLEFLGEDKSAAKAPTAIPTGALALVEILRRITEQKIHPLVGRTKFQKLAYFATAVGIPTSLTFRRASYGPFADDLKPTFRRLLNHGLLEEERRGRMFATTVGRTYLDAENVRREDLQRWDKEIERVADLMMRMDTADAEIAATVHFTWSELHDDTAMGQPSEADVLEAVLKWKRRRQEPLDPAAVASTIRNLNWLGWINAAPSQLPTRSDPLMDDVDALA